MAQEWRRAAGGGIEAEQGEEGGLSCSLLSWKLCSGLASKANKTSKYGCRRVVSGGRSVARRGLGESFYFYRGIFN